MKASVKNVDVRGIVQAVSNLKKNNAAGLFAANEARRLMEPFVPRREGILADARTEPWKVIYDEPYARKQYKDHSLNHPKPPNIKGRPEWDKAIDKDQLSRALTSFLKR